MRTRGFFFGSILLAFLALAACSSDDTSTSSGGTTSTGAGTSACNDDPFSCPAGDTCWIDMKGSAYTCLASGAGKVGEACQNSGGKATCGDGLTCFSVPGYDVCTPFCDPSNAAHACASGESCAELQLPGTSATIFACKPAMPSGTGGAGGTGAGGGSTTATTVGAGGAGGAGGAAMGGAGGV